ncbi:glycoside hydrolase family protein [Pontiella agarivorans]|uniref:Glycoside hydrolase family protein n=1 Tax=Pontiella agarivorans TaxID=3038953 RepID=A0ABU5MSB4_9BACT|nr:glycoside hydrolase family protein [Pontiella agarivorans]MDZ8117085.1 glycoside hydrolase family protein [Pontiella agarivorans]
MSTYARINILVGLSVGIAAVTANGMEKKKHVVERERPAEWKNLVFGGRFADRFLPMPDLGGMTSDTWGETNVVPREVRNGIEDPEWSYWGGNTMLEEDGKFHLMVARWPEDAPKGHMSWFDSEVAHAVSDSPYGPFEVTQVIGPGHNPTYYRTQSGQYMLYIIDGWYTADSVNGPWTEVEVEYDSRDRKNTKQKNYLHNNTFIKREDGSFYMLNRHGQAWFSKDGIDTYYRVSPEIVYPKVPGRFEDPLVWKDHIQYHLIVNDWAGRIAWHQRSRDGVNWVVEPGEAYMPGIAVNENGTKEDWFKFERIRVVQDEYGRPFAANFAVIDVLKHSDLPNDKHNSKLIVIPMTVGRLLTVMNKEPITAETKTIRVKVQAEDDFNPHTDLDLDSLRFGASSEVNFGRGCRVVKSRKQGDDLVLVFDAKGNGFSEENFAGKLLGKNKEGKMLFGWTRLPGIDYLEPILSARLPVFKGKTANVEVQNFGQVASESAVVTVIVDDREVASGAVPALNPFEKIDVKLKTGKVQLTPKSKITVRLDCKGKTVEELTRSMKERK